MNSEITISSKNDARMYVLDQVSIAYPRSCLTNTLILVLRLVRKWLKGKAFASFTGHFYRSILGDFSRKTGLAAPKTNYQTYSSNTCSDGAQARLLQDQSCISPKVQACYVPAHQGFECQGQSSPISAVTIFASVSGMISHFEPFSRTLETLVFFSRQY